MVHSVVIETTVLVEDETHTTGYPGYPAALLTVAESGCRRGAAPVVYLLRPPAALLSIQILNTLGHPVKLKCPASEHRVPRTFFAVS